MVLRGRDAAGRDFFDRAQIVSIDETGARIQTRFQLIEGSTVMVEMPGETTPLQFRVAWSGEAESFYDGMVGLELTGERDVWPVESLSVRWAARNQ